MPIVFQTSLSGSIVQFGALSLAGADGLAAPVSATAITDAGGTNLVLAGGIVSPDTGGGVTSGTVVFDDATEWTVMAVAGAYGVKDLTELAAANAVATAGQGILLRGGNYNLTAEWGNIPTGCTLQSHDTTDRANLLCGGVNSYGAWDIPDNVTVQQVNFLGDYTVANQGTGNATPMIAFNKVISGITFDDCVLDGAEDPVSPFGWHGLIGGDGSFGLTGAGLTVKNCAINNARRGLNIRGGDTGGPFTATGNTFNENKTDGIVVSELVTDLVIIGNQMINFGAASDTVTEVLSVDTTLDRIQIADTSNWGTSGALNFASTTTTLPTGADLTTDYQYTVIDGTTIEFDTFDLVDAGTNVFVRVEPPHGDFIQIINTDGLSEVRGGKIMLNEMYAINSTGTRDDPGYQGIFSNTLTATQAVLSVDTATDRITVADTSRFDVPNKFLRITGTVLPTGVSSSTDYQYIVIDGTTIEFVDLDLVDSGTSLTIRSMDGRTESLQIGGNRYVGNASAGERLEAADNCIIAGNEFVYLSGYAVPRVVQAGTGNRFSIPGDNNIIADNVGGTIVSGAFSLGYEINNVEAKIDDSIGFGLDAYYSAIFDGPVYDATTVAEVRTIFGPKASSAIDTASPKIGIGGYADFDAVSFDHPRQNTPTLSGSFADATGQATATLVETGPVQITAVNKAWPEADAALNGANVYAIKGNSPEVRVTSDVGGSVVVTDWTTSQNVIAASGHYIWFRDTSSGSATTTTTARLYIGDTGADWSITTA